MAKEWFYIVPKEEMVEKKKGPGRGWWGPPKGTHGKGISGGKKGKDRKMDAKGKELLIQHYAANTLADGYKLTKLNFNQRMRALQRLGLAKKDPDTGMLELTEAARKFLHSKACEQEAVRRRKALYKK